MRVLITQKINGVETTTDYTRYVLDGTLTIEDSVNVPTLITFTLSPSDSSFQVPNRSAYVRIQSDVYDPATDHVFFGGYGSGRVLATGFITNTPERQYLGLNKNLKQFGFQQYAYVINVTSDEWLLNSQAVPYIPAFVNQTDSQILAGIAQALFPGYFDVTSLMASGNLVPYFQYDPSQTWSNIAKTFADANRYHYKVVNKQIIYQPFGDVPLGISYDDTKMKEASLFPLEFQSQVLTVPPVNDCIVIGDVEPQTNWDNYFVGDGFTSNFPLRHQVFDGLTNNLLSDDWTETSFQQGVWIVNDPQNVISLIDVGGNALGALNVIQKGNTGVYTPIQNATFIQAQNGIELGGGLNLQHGQVTFNDTAVGGGGLIGGIFTETTNFSPGNCLAGFQVEGQGNLGTFTVVKVQVPVGNSVLVNLTLNGTAPANIIPGNVFTCAGFTAAAFLNGTTQIVVSVKQISTSQYTIVAQREFIYGLPFGPVTDSGQITFAANSVVVTASGAAGIVVQPIYNGQLVGTQVVSQPNHQYVLQTWIGVRAKNRFTRPYTNLTQTATYGNDNLTAAGDLTFVITDVNLGQFVIEQQNPLFGLFPAAPAPIVTKFTISNANLPSFAIYTLISAIDLNVSINYTVLSLPPQGELWVQSLTGASGGNLPWLPSQLTPPIVYQLGFGMVNQTAQIGQSGEVNELQFYTDDIPSVGARIRFQSWAAGQSVARVQDSVAIASEAQSVGDTGIRSAILQNLSPLPRTSDECEAAAAAAILDREYPQFQGTYTIQTIPYRFENLFSPRFNLYPTSGEYFYVNSLVRGISGQNFYVNTVRIQVVEMRQEVLTISLDYGPDLYLEKMLPAFLESQQNLLVPSQTTAPPNPITLPQVLNAHLPTLDNAQITAQVNSLSGNYVVIDLGAIPVTGCEVRNVDSGWGVADHGRVGLFKTRVFTVPRTIRDQTWYLRTLNGAIFSRFSKALRVVAPLIPSSPTLVAANSSSIVLDYAGDVRDIYGLSLVAPGLSGVFIFPEQPGATNEVTFFERVNFQGLLQGNDLEVANFVFQGGDIVAFNCPSDFPFTGHRVLSGVQVLGSGNQTRSFWLESPSLPYPASIGDRVNACGTATLIYRSPAVPAASGEIISWTYPTDTTNINARAIGLCQVVTESPHGMVLNQNFFISTFWPTIAATVKNSIWNGIQVFVTKVINTTTFQFTIGVDPRLILSPIPLSPLAGLVAPLPASNAGTLINTQPGQLLARPVFSQADLTIDLGQPDIAAALSVIEAGQGGLRVSGLQCYFFNLTWDFSAPTIVPSFNVPTITGITVLPDLNGISWGIATGAPSGYRVLITDPATGETINKFTIDHPYNQQALTQFEMFQSDAEKPRIVSVTPFDILGDGFPNVTFWPGASGGSGGFGTAYPECIDVRMFGAVGDGITDDTAAVQGALSTAFAAAQMLVTFEGAPTVLQTIVCIPSSMICVVKPQYLDGTPTNNGFGPTGVALRMGSGTTLRIDGQLQLQPPDSGPLLNTPWVAIENNLAYAGVDQDIVIEGTGSINCNGGVIPVVRLPVSNVHPQAMRVAGGQAYLIDDINQIVYRIDLNRPHLVAAQFQFYPVLDQSGIGDFSQMEVDDLGYIYMGLGGGGNGGEIVCMDPTTLSVISTGGSSPDCPVTRGFPIYCNCQDPTEICIGNPGDIVFVPFGPGYIASADRIQVCVFNDVAVFEKFSLGLTGQASIDAQSNFVFNNPSNVGVFYYGGCGLSTPGTPAMSADKNGNIFVLVSQLSPSLILTVCRTAAGTAGTCFCCNPGDTCFYSTVGQYQSVFSEDIGSIVSNVGDHCIGLCPDGTQMIATSEQTKIFKYDVNTNTFTSVDLAAYNPIFDRHSFKSIDQTTGFMIIRGSDSFIKFDTVGMQVVTVYSDIAAEAAKTGNTISVNQGGQTEYDPTTSSVVFNFADQAYKIALESNPTFNVSGAIKFVGVQNGLVSGITIEQSTSYGVYMQYCVASIVDNMIMPANFTQVGFGVLVDKCDACSIVNCSVNGSHNVYNLLAFVGDYGSEGTLVDENLVTAISGAGVIRNNLGFEDLTPGQQYAGLTISNNIFADGTATTSVTISIVSTGPSTLDFGIAIRSNTIVNNDQTAILLANVADCQINDNMIVANSIGITKAAGSILQNVTIANNVVHGQTGFDFPKYTTPNSPIYVDGQSTCTMYNPAADPLTYQSWAPAQPLIENSTGGLSGYIFPPEPPNSLYGVQPQTGIQNGVILSQNGSLTQIIIAPFNILWTDKRISYAGPLNSMGQPIPLNAPNSYTTYYVFVDDPYRDGNPATIQYGATTEESDLATSAGRYFLGAIQLTVGGNQIGTAGGDLPPSAFIPVLQPYDIGCTWQGLIPANTILVHLPMVRVISFAPNYVPSEAHLLTPAAATWQLSILKNAVQVGTISFTTGSNFANFSGGPVTFNQLDILEVESQSPSDVSASDLGLILSAFRGFLIPDPAIQLYLTDSLNFWQDLFGAFSPQLPLVLTDNTFNNWADLVISFIDVSGFYLPLSDNLNFWLDQVTVPSFSDSLNNWHDQVTTDIEVGAFGFTDSLNNWLDQLNSNLPIVAESLADNLNNWLDAIRTNAPTQSISISDSLSLSDAITQFVAYLATFTDSLNNWVDSVQVVFIDQSISDNLNNWADLLVKASVYSLPFTETINVWSDLAIPQSQASGVTASDSINFWGDAFRTSFPLQQVTATDSLNNWKDFVPNFIVVYNLATTSETMTMQDAIETSGGGGNVRIDLVLTDTNASHWSDFAPTFFVMGWNLIVTETINYWEDALAKHLS